MNPLVLKNSLLTQDRLDSLETLINQVRKLPGDIAEVGVYKGGTALLLAENTNKMLHLFDTFTGMPEADSTIDLHKKGDFHDTTVEQVSNLLKGENFKIYPGLFPQQTGSNIENLKFSFVYLDVDIYSSTKDCLEFFYPKMSPGGIIVSDDYLAPTCAGVKKAVDEFMIGKPETLIHPCKYQCYIIKK